MAVATRSTRSTSSRAPVRRSEGTPTRPTRRARVGARSWQELSSEGGGIMRRAEDFGVWRGG